jgi:hypothetical protein
MVLHEETPPLTGSIVRNGAPVDWNVLAASFYSPQSQMAIAIDDGSYAVANIARRFRLALPTAKLVCALAQVGGSQ